MSPTLFRIIKVIKNCKYLTEYNLNNKEDENLNSNVKLKIIKKDLTINNIFFKTVNDVEILKDCN